MYLELLILALTILSSVFGTRNSYILPTPLGPEAPICRTYSQLCHLAYNLTELGTGLGVVQSTQEICQCPGGQTCETSWFDRDNSIMKVFKVYGHDMTVKMSYCNLVQPNIVCRKDQEAIIMRGRGAFVFEIEADFSCRCYRNLYEHRSWSEGTETLFAYSCGKPKCRINSHPRPVCALMTYAGAPGLHHVRYDCRCLRNQECRTPHNRLPTRTRPFVRKHCTPTSATHGAYDQNNLQITNYN